MHLDPATGVVTGVADLSGLRSIDPDASWIDTWLTSGGVVLFADDVLGVAG